MGIESINEPDGRTWMVTPVSINEPPDLAAIPGTPTITSLAPTSAVIGDPSFTLVVTGTNFYDGSVIVFAGNDEPTTYTDAQTVSTGVDMNVWLGADTVPVQVRNFNMVSNSVDFVFTATAAVTAAAHEAPGADPDDLEEEINEAAEEGDFKPVHRGRIKRKK